MLFYTDMNVLPIQKADQITCFCVYIERPMTQQFDCGNQKEAHASRHFASMKTLFIQLPSALTANY